MKKEFNMKHKATKWSKDQTTPNEKLQIAFQLAGAEGTRALIKKHKSFLMDYINLKPLQICEIIESNRLLMA